jgi:hypothetical protein
MRLSLYVGWDFRIRANFDQIYDIFTYLFQNTG